MTRLHNDASAFVREMTEGFVLANSKYVRMAPGGVVRSTKSDEGTVAVITGGGSGHYPAFAGLVGPGLAAGAAMGNVFASPSTHQIESVSLAAQRGGGVIFIYGNYAGDVLNFDAAQAALRDRGVDCRTVTVTDDIFSARRDDRARRRGIAGDLAVIKVAGAAAERGDSLDDIEQIAIRANERTRSFGVAFSGCTLPGEAEPLFNVPAGRMAVGLGIHGEPGIDETDLPSADQLGRLLVERLLDERPDDIVSADGARVVPILNGLGTVKYEELFVVYRSIARALAAAGVEAVDPQVGEFCTSFDMAGASLTLFWLDDELETLWAAGCDSAGYRKGDVGLREIDDRPFDGLVEEPANDQRAEPASASSRRGAQIAAAAITIAAQTIDENVAELGRLDSIAGDGDHGIGMQRGVHAAELAAREAADAGLGLGSTLGRAGDAWADNAGGTSGALWGLALRTAGTALGDQVAPGSTRVADAVARAVAALQERGKAQLGDKTMLDALIPFSLALTRHASDGTDLAAGWGRAADDAQAAAAASADLVPLIGRARPHAEKSVGTPDPGAVSFALIAKAVSIALNKEQFDNA